MIPHDSRAPVQQTPRSSAMFATCIHCNASLGRNDVIEAFPIGRRLAFDAARGRLWVICPACDRWNLTPLEERWEAIEQCERLYRGSPIRSATGEIGLARVADRVDLIRVGSPVPLEAAAWRYGDQLPRRWRRRTLPAPLRDATTLQTFGFAGGAFYLASGSLAASFIGSGLGIATSILSMRLMTRDLRARVVQPDGRVTSVRALAAIRMVIDPSDDGGWSLRTMRIRNAALGTDVAQEREASRMLRGILAYRNDGARSRDQLAGAVSTLADARDPRAFIARLARASQKAGDVALEQYPADMIVALEMAIHDDTERRALEGELPALAAEWALAEEVASVADDMFVPPEVRARLGQLKTAAVAPMPDTPGTSR